MKAWVSKRCSPLNSNAPDKLPCILVGQMWITRQADEKLPDDLVSMLGGRTYANNPRCCEATGPLSTTMSFPSSSFAAALVVPAAPTIGVVNFSAGPLSTNGQKVPLCFQCSQNLKSFTWRRDPDNKLDDFSSRVLWYSSATTVRGQARHFARTFSRTCMLDDYPGHPGNDQSRWSSLPPKPFKASLNSPRHEQKQVRPRPQSPTLSFWG